MVHNPNGVIAAVGQTGHYYRVARHSVIDALDSGNAPRGGEVHIYCYRLFASLGQVHAYQTTSSDNMISIKPYMV